MGVAKEVKLDGNATRKINGRDVKTHSVCVTGDGVCAFVEAGSTGRTGEVVREKSARSFLQMDFRHGDYLVEPVYDKKRCVGFILACCGDENVGLLNGVMTFAREVLLYGKVRSKEKRLVEAVFMEGNQKGK